MSELKPCPFCGGEAELHPSYDMETDSVDGWFAWCNNKECECAPETREHFTEAEAIAAWNTRAEYHGYEQAAIEAWESIKKWNTCAELGSGTLTAEQVRDLIERHSDASGGNGRDFHNGAYEAIADELNATMGGGECEAIHDKGYYKGIHGYCEGLKCSYCGEPLFSEFGFCPWCGARIRKAVEQ